MKLRYLLGFLLLLVMSGCMSSPKPKLVEVYPAWFNQPSSDSSVYDYAVADGKNRDDAIANALNQIASKISVSVKSKFQSNTVVDNNSYNKSSQMDVYNKVEKIHFNNYSILHEKRLQSGYLISLKVNKIELAKSLKNKIDSRFANISNNLNMKYKNSVLKLRTYTKILHSLKALNKKIYILSSVNKRISIKKYLIKQSRIRDIILKFHDSVTFHIQGPDNKYKKVLYNLITQKGYKINKYNALIRLKISITKKMIHVLSYKVIKGIIVLQVIDKNDGSVLGEKRLVLGGKSISSFTQADEFMLNSFRKRVKNKNILSKLLGI